MADDRRFQAHKAEEIPSGHKLLVFGLVLFFIIIALMVTFLTAPVVVAPVEVLTGYL